jgi:hypothetical protein
MADYRHLQDVVKSMTAANASELLATVVIPDLVDRWVDEYASYVGGSVDIVETEVNEFSYLFDITGERLIAAYGISRGKHTGKRDASRMAGHPLSAGSQYHRGHAIPHTLGGPTDINLVAQLGKVNIGAFRPLERRAVATQGSLYFTYWRYAGASQTPIGVEQGLATPGVGIEVRVHGN